VFLISNEFIRAYNADKPSFVFKKAPFVKKCFANEKMLLPSLFDFNIF